MVLLGVIALCWVIVLAVVLTHFSKNRTSTWDERLQAIATQLLLTIPADSVPDTRARPRLHLRDSGSRDGEGLVFQIWVDQTMLVARTPGAPDSPLQPIFKDGTVSTTVANRHWRVYSTSDDAGRVNVQVGILQSVVDADLRHEALHALSLATVLLVLAGIITWLVTQHSLRSVKTLGRTMRDRHSLDLTPLPFGRLPQELHPLILSFNHLLGQLDKAIEGERRFIGDAAHELRTPLSALQVQAAIALRADNVADKDVALARLLVVARRSTRLAEQLLDLARLNAGTKAPQHTDADLSELVRHVAQEFEVVASHNRRSLRLEVEPCVIRCNIDEIGILLRNLLDNALRYTAEGGNVLVRCGYQTRPDLRRKPAVYLEVADDGLGVPLEQREAIFERFHRVAGTLVSGSGIGLSLVAGIALLHKATIQTDTGLDKRGLLVRVVFPTIAASQDVAITGLRVAVMAASAAGVVH
jgi:signal transduction histidine kinase